MRFFWIALEWLAWRWRRLRPLSAAQVVRSIGCRGLDMDSFAAAHRGVVWEMATLAAEQRIPIGVLIVMLNFALAGQPAGDLSARRLGAVRQVRAELAATA